MFTLKKSVCSALSLAILMSSMPALADLNGATGNIETQIKEKMETVKQEQAAVADLKASVEHAEKVSTTTSRIAISAMVVGGIVGTGAWVFGSFGDAIDSVATKLVGGSKIGTGEEVEWAGGALVVASIGGGGLAIYLTDSQKDKLSKDLTDAQNRLDADRTQLEDLETAPSAQ